MSEKKNNLKDDFKKAMVNGAGCAIGGALVCGVIGLVFAGPVGGVVGLKVGAGAGGAGGMA